MILKRSLIFQTMTEQSRRLNQSMPSGRQMLYRVFSEYDLERQRGGMISHQQLLNVRLSGSNIQDLEKFRDKILFIRSSMEDEDLPKASTLESFLYENIKHRPKLSTIIDRYENAGPGISACNAACWMRVGLPGPTFNTTNATDTSTKLGGRGSAYLSCVC